MTVQPNPPNQPLPPNQHWLYYAIGGVLLLALIATAVCGFAVDGAGGEIFQGVNPILGALFGWWAADLYFRRDANKKLDRDVKSAAYTINVMLQRLFEVDVYIARASNNLNESKYQLALQELYAATASIRGQFSQGYQAIRHWEGLSRKAAEQAKQEFEQDQARIGQRQQIQPGNQGNGGNGNA